MLKSNKIFYLNASSNKITNTHVNFVQLTTKLLIIITIGLEIPRHFENFIIGAIFKLEIHNTMSK